MKNSKTVGVILAVFFGFIGLHHSYIGNYKLSFIYAFFSFTGIPAILGIFEAFLMPQRVQDNENEVSLLYFLAYPIGGVVSAFIVVITVVWGAHTMRGDIDSGSHLEESKSTKSLVNQLEENVDPANRGSLLTAGQYKILKDFLSKMDQNKIELRDIFHVKVRGSSDWPEIREEFKKFHNEFRKASSLSVTRKQERTPGDDSESENVLPPKFDTENTEVTQPKIKISSSITFTLESEDNKYKFELLEMKKNIYLGSLTRNGKEVYPFNREEYFY